MINFVSVAVVQARARRLASTPATQLPPSLVTV